MESSKTLKVEEILEYLGKLSYRINKDVLTNCESDQIITLYSSLLEKIGIIKNQNLKIEINFLDIFHTTNLHERPILIRNLYFYLKKFLSEVLNFDNFDMGDLFNPSQKKTTQILTRIIKFLKFKETQKSFYNTMMESKTLAKMKLEESKQNLEKIISENKVLNKKEEVAVIDCKNLTNELKLVEKVKNETIKNLKILKENYTQFANQLQKEEEKISMTDEQLIRYANEISNLKKKLVSSPEKIENILKEFEVKNSFIKNEIAEKENNLSDINIISSNFDIFESMVNKINNLQKDLENENSKLKILIDKFNSKSDSFNKANKSFEDKTFQLGKIDGKISNLKNILKENLEKNQQDRKIKENELEELRNKFNDEKKKVDEEDNILNGIKEENIAIKKKLDELIPLKNEFKLQYEEQMASLLEAVKDYSKNFWNMLEEYFER